jgi:hypothetical protein
MPGIGHVFPRKELLDGIPDSAQLLHSTEIDLGGVKFCPPEKLQKVTHSYRWKLKEDV